MLVCVLASVGPISTMEVPWSSESLPAGNSCKKNRLLTVATRYLNRVLICHGCNRLMSHNYGAFIQGIFMCYIQHKFHPSLIEISSNLMQLSKFYFTQSSLKIELCRNLWILVHLFWPFITVRINQSGGVDEHHSMWHDYCHELCNNTEGLCMAPEGIWMSILWLFE